MLAELGPVATDALNRMSRARAEIDRLEPRLQRARSELHEAIVDAHAAGVDTALIVQVSGLTRQRVAQIVGRER